MKPDELMNRLIKSVKAVIESFPLNSLDEPDGYVDLTCRLVLEFSKNKITVVPTSDHDILTLLKKHLCVSNEKH